nr:reverse transcriptase domain-containing protein [Tanacetum cinerariifolium]
QFTSPTLTPFRDSDFLLFEEAEAFLGLEDDPDSPKINPFYYDPKGDILLLEAILNSEPSHPLPNQDQNLPSFKEELKAYEAKTVKSSIEEPPKVKLKDLPHHFEYAFLEGDNKLPVIIAKELRTAPVSTPMPNLKPSIPYPSRHDNERRRGQANEQIEKFYEIFKDMSFEISFTDALILMPKFASTLKALIRNKEKLSEMGRTPMNEHCSAVILNKLPKKLGDPGKFLIPCEFSGMDECLALADLDGKQIDVTDEACKEYFQEVLGFSNVTASGNPTPSDDPIVSSTSLTLTLFGDSDFLLFEEANAFLGLKDDPDSPKLDPSYYDPEGTSKCLKLF